MNFTRIVSIVVVLVALSACTATDIRNLDAELVQLYQAKLDAAQTTEASMLLESTKLALSQLADTAADSAAQQQSTANKISLYRIAVTAAWQAERDDIQTLVAAGTSMCRTEEVANLAPRDCGMLMTMPVFAAVDLNTRRFDAISGQFSTTPQGAMREQAYGEQARKVFADYQAAAELFFIGRPSLLALNASPEFFNNIDDRIETLFRLAVNTQGLIQSIYRAETLAVEVQDQFPGRTVREQTECLLVDIREQAIQAGLDTQSVSPLAAARCD